MNEWALTHSLTNQLITHLLTKWLILWPIQHLHSFTCFHMLNHLYFSWLTHSYSLVSPLIHIDVFIHWLTDLFTLWFTCSKTPDSTHQVNTWFTWWLKRGKVTKLFWTVALRTGIDHLIACQLTFPPSHNSHTHVLIHPLPNTLLFTPRPETPIFAHGACNCNYSLPYLGAIHGKHHYFLLP